MIKNQPSAGSMPHSQYSMPHSQYSVPCTKEEPLPVGQAEDADDDDDDDEEDDDEEDDDVDVVVDVDVDDEDDESAEALRRRAVSGLPFGPAMNRHRLTEIGNVLVMLRGTSE